MLVVQEIICFFRAVLHQLYVNPNSHGIIRVAGVELLREKDLLKVILNIRGYNIYLVSMSCQGTSCAESIIIQAVADVFNLKIILIIESHPDFAEMYTLWKE